MQFAIVSVVAEFDIKIAEVIKQKNVLTLVAISENVPREVKCVELLVSGEVGKISMFHKQTGLTSEINKKRAAHQMSRPALYITTKILLEYN